MRRALCSGTSPTKSTVSLRFTVGLSREKYKETARNFKFGNKKHKSLSLRFTIGLSGEKYKETARNLGIKSNHVRRNREGSQ